MRSIATVTLMAAIALAILLMARGQWVLYIGIVLGSFATACLIGTVIRCGLGDDNADAAAHTPRPGLGSTGL